MALPSRDALPLGCESSLLDWLVLAGFDHARLLSLKPNAASPSTDGYDPLNPLPPDRLPYRVRLEPQLEALRYAKYTSILLNPTDLSLATRLAAPLSPPAEAMEIAGTYALARRLMSIPARGHEAGYVEIVSTICRFVTFLAPQVDPQLAEDLVDASLVNKRQTGPVQMDLTLMRGLQPVACVEVMRHDVGGRLFPALVDAVEMAGSDGILLEGVREPYLAVLTKLCIAMTAPLANDPPGPPTRLGIMTDTTSYIAVQLALGSESLPELFVSPCMPITSRAPSIFATLGLSLLWNEHLQLPDQKNILQVPVQTRLDRSSQSSATSSVTALVSSDEQMGVEEGHPTLLVRFHIYATGTDGLHELHRQTPQLPSRLSSDTISRERLASDCLLPSFPRPTSTSAAFSLLTITSGPVYGRTGAVYSAHFGNGVQVAIKYSRAGCAADLEREAVIYQHILSALPRGVVPRFLGFFSGGYCEPEEGGTRVAIILEHCGIAVKVFSDLSSRASISLYHQLVTLHEYGVIHQDFDPRNVLLDPAGNTTIIDFSEARSNHQCKGSACGELYTARSKLGIMGDTL